MAPQIHNSGWLPLLAPIAWLAVKVIERLFGDFWNRSRSIPYNNENGDHGGTEE